MSKITLDDLIRQLDQLDEHLVHIWLETSDEKSKISKQNDVWDKFVELLETRVDLLMTLRDAGMRLEKELVWPPWLESLCLARTGMMKDRLKNMVAEDKQKQRIKTYKDMGTT